MGEEVVELTKEGDYAKKMFASISIIGRVAYSLYGLELYLKEQGEDFSKWEPIFQKLWSFSEIEYVDEYMYLFVEYLAECVLEFDYYNADDCEYMTEDEFWYTYHLYKECKYMDDVNFIMECINDMLGTHMYAGIVPPAEYSLNVISEKVYPFFLKKIKKKIEIEPFKIYSIYDEGCWGKMHSKEILLQGI